MGAVAEGLGLGVAGTIGVTAAGGAIGTAAGHYGINTALGVPYTGTDAVIDVATGGLAGGFSGAQAGSRGSTSSRRPPRSAWAPARWSRRHCQTALQDGRVKPTAPVNHLNRAMTEELGWQSAANQGQIGVMGPGKLTALGPDYITFDPSTMELVVWDAEYSSCGRFPSGQIPASKMSSWSSFISDAVNNYTGPNAAAAVKQALANGEIRGDYFTYP